MGGLAKALDIFRREPWWLLGLKLGALLSFCGGPLALADWLKLRIDGNAAFAIAFFPIVTLIFGVYSLKSPVPDRWDWWMVRLGAAGALLLLGMNVFGAWWLAEEPGRPDAGLIAFGIVVGTLYAAWYLRAAAAFSRKGALP